MICHTLGLLSNLLASPCQNPQNDPECVTSSESPRMPLLVQLIIIVTQLLQDLQRQIIVWSSCTSTVNNYITWQHVLAHVPLSRACNPSEALPWVVFLGSVIVIALTESFKSPQDKVPRGLRDQRGALHLQKSSAAPQVLHTLQRATCLSHVILFQSFFLHIYAFRSIKSGQSTHDTIGMLYLCEVWRYKFSDRQRATRETGKWTVRFRKAQLNLGIGIVS